MIRFLSDVLVGVPSIVLGYFGYVTMVEWLGWNFSVAAASIVLAMISICPISAVRRASLRCDRCRTICARRPTPSGPTIGRSFSAPCVSGRRRRASYGRPARPVDLGRRDGAAIYTAGWSSYLWDGRLTTLPIGYLTYVIWTFINEPFAAANALAYAAAFLVTAFVLVISLISRLILAAIKLET